MDIKIEDLVSHLKQMKETHGEETYRSALESLARNLISNDSGKGFLENLLTQLGDTLDIPRIQKEAEERVSEAAEERPATEEPQKRKPLPDHGFLADALKQQMPNLKTQAHFDVAVSAMEALQLTLNAAFGGDVEMAQKAKGALDQTISLAHRLAGISEQLQDPEVASAVTNRDFVEPPRGSSEQEQKTVDRLLSELPDIKDTTHLNQWYAAHRSAMDRVMSQSLRNRLFDEIRKKKASLSY